MSKTATLKKALMLLSLGGTTFVCISLPSFSAPGIPLPGCCGLDNTNLSGFYSDVCSAGVAEFADTTRDVMQFPAGGDLDTIVITPVEAFMTSVFCDNCIPDEFPLDPGVAAWLE